MIQHTKTMKLLIYPDQNAISLFQKLTTTYAKACDFISDYVFNNGFVLNFMELQKVLYSPLRDSFDLKAQMTISALKTVTARYKTVKEQLQSHPYKYKDEKEEWHYIPRTLEWLLKPVQFRRPQADLVRGRDYSFVRGENGQSLVSINTLGKRVKVAFEVPACFEEYFQKDTPWSFGTAKLVELNKKWYLHIPVTMEIEESEASTSPAHVVGIDRGLRFLATAYDESGKTLFIRGNDILNKRDRFKKVRAELQSKGTKSAKRALNRISGRENRWMSDVNHQLTKTLVDTYGPNTLFVIEDLKDVSFCEENLKKRNSDGRNELRTWSFYQFEQMLKYKAEEEGSMVLKVAADYTSQRCPKCGRIHKENRHHDIHEYICDACGYRSNDDRVGAMNIYTLGTMFVSGDSNPRYGVRKQS